MFKNSKNENFNTCTIQTKIGREYLKNHPVYPSDVYTQKRLTIIS